VLTSPPTECHAVLRTTVDNLTHLQRRVVLDAFESAHASRLDRTAAEFERSRPIPGEFTGNSSPADLSRRWRELTEIAQALRARAELLRMGVSDPELESLLDELIAC
jgi:hypothetical protein